MHSSDTHHPEADMGFNTFLIFYDTLFFMVFSGAINFKGKPIHRTDKLRNGLCSWTALKSVSLLECLITNFALYMHLMAVLHFFTFSSLTPGSLYIGVLKGLVSRVLPGILAVFRR